MKVLVFTIVSMCCLVFAGCEVQSDIAKKSVEDYQPSPTPPRVELTPEVFDPAEIATADTSKQGALLPVNDDDANKTLNCKEYNRVQINGSRNEVTITGVCSQIMINGQGNTVSAEAVVEVVTFGGQNVVTYSKVANGKRPMINDTAGTNSVEKVAATQPPKKK